jgi:hypothetical protein
MHWQTNGLGGIQHPENLFICSLRTNILYKPGRYIEALKEIEELLPLIEKINGPDHPNTLETKKIHKNILEN